MQNILQKHEQKKKPTTRPKIQQIAVMFLNMLFGLQKFALMFCCISSLLVCVHLFNVSDVLKGLHVLTMIR